MRISGHLALLVAVTVAGSVAEAQSPEPEDPLYQVEIIVFAHNDGNPGDEDFQHDVEAPLDAPPPTRLRLPRPELDSLFGFGRPAEPEPVAPEATSGATAESSTGRADGLELIERSATGDGTVVPSSDRVPDGFRVLGPDELELGDVSRRLARIGTRPYTVLGHAGWIQTGIDPERSLPLDLSRLGITNPAGTIELYLTRYLHVALDLTYVAGNGTFWTAPPAGAGLAPFTYAERFRFEFDPESRAIRSGELHYLDHPMFGVLIQIRPAPEPEATQAQPGGPAG